MPETSTTSVDNPDDDASKSTTVTDPAAETDNGTAKTDDNPDASKSDDTTVVTDDDKSKETTTKTDDTPAPPALDDDIDDWAAKKGLPKATTDTEREAYQTQRNEQREYTRTRQAEKEAADAKALGDEIHKAKTEVASDDDDDDLDPIEKRQNKIEADLKAERETRQQSEFYFTNKVTDEEHKALLDIYKEKTSRPTSPEAKKAAVEYWSSVDALPDLLDLAKARLSKAPDTAAVAEKAAREERERIARESEANSPGRSATTTTTTGKSEDEARTERFKDRFK